MDNQRPDLSGVQLAEQLTDWFWQPVPISVSEIGSGQSNFYVYVQNDPVNYIDENGNTPTVVVGGGVGLGLAGISTFVSDILDDGSINSGWETYASNAAGGLAAGIAGGLGIINPYTLSAIESGVSKLVKTLLTCEKFSNYSLEDLAEYAFDIVLGGLTGNMAKKLIPRGAGRTPNKLKSQLTSKVGKKLIGQATLAAISATSIKTSATRLNTNRKKLGNQ